MHAEEPTDLIRLEGEGNSIIVRITAKERPSAQGSPEVLGGEILVDTPFVRGSTRIWVFPEDLREWREALDVLDVGEGYVSWREGGRGPEMFLERDVTNERVHVTIKDDAGALTAVTVTVTMTDSWFDDAYERLDRTWKTWNPAED
jgi:hypothetical protein